MKTAVISIRIDKDVKTKAQKLAKELGMSLSALIIVLLKHFIRTKKINFDLNEALRDS